MAAQTVSFETGHEEMIHDAQLDYYGKRLATASSDRTIKIFEIINDNYTPVAHIKGHEGPVWQVAWAHPKFGSLLASCSYDAKIRVWREETRNNWTLVFEDTSHEASVNAVAWAPHTYGICLAAASADGNVSIFTYKDNKQWDRKKIAAHKGGVNSISWGPDIKIGTLLALSQFSGNNQMNQQQLIHSKIAKRFVTGGCDNRIKIWRYNENDGQWTEQKSYSGDNNHADWVRDVAWAPSMGVPTNTIASCSEDKTVIIWTEDAHGVWSKKKTISFKTKVWKVSWSVMGNILAVSQGDNKVSLWKETLDGEWRNLSEVKDGSESEKKENKDGKIEQ